MSKNKPIGETEVKEAYSILQKYKQGKQSLESRIIDEEMFWKQRQWDVLQTDKTKPVPPTSSWMFNSIANKHADAMDSFPEAICLPREQSDEASAKTLSSVIPVILKHNDFEQVYSDNWWYKLKHGCAAYGVFWDNSASEGKGDAVVKRVDLLNIFWEPGEKDIQKSRNLFIVDLVHTDVLNMQYPKADIRGGDNGELASYIHDDTVDTSDKVLVVDWYYKKNGKLHLCKFCEEKVLFASENDEKYIDGWYTDGNYPIVFDVLYPEEDTPTGFGIISITKNPQLIIDKLDGAILDNTKATSKPRYFFKDLAGINEKEFLDLENTLVHTSGSVNEDNIRAIDVKALPGQVMEFRQAKINELKEGSSNNDFSQGTTSGGVTSGAAIAVLQEAGNKTSRDATKTSYRAFEKIVVMLIERLRQFYTQERTFRITGNGESYKYVNFSNENIVNQSLGTFNGEELFRKPIFDIDVKAQKMNPYSTLSQNETAMNLFDRGFCNPQFAHQALCVLPLMSFEGKAELEEKLREGMTLQKQIEQLTMEKEQLIMQLKGVQKASA